MNELCQNVLEFNQTNYIENWFNSHQDQNPLLLATIKLGRGKKKTFYVIDSEH